MVEHPTATSRPSARTFVRRRLDPDARSGLRLTLVAVAFLLVGVSLGLILRLVEDTEGRVARADRDLIDEVHSAVVDHGWLVDALHAITFLGTSAVLTVACTAAILVLQRGHHPRAAAFVAVTALLGGLLNVLLKSLVRRPRPLLLDPITTARGWSFPSGHTMGSVVCLGAIAVALGPLLGRRARRRMRWGAAAVAATIGLTRVALGVHYLTDVVAGALLGLAWLCLSVVVFAQDRPGGTPGGGGDAVDRAVAEPAGGPAGTVHADGH